MINWKISDLSILVLMSLSAILGYVKDFFIGNQEELGIGTFFFFTGLTFLFGMISFIDIYKQI